MGLVSFKDDVTFSINNVCEVKSVYVMLPFVKEMLNTVFCYVHQASLQESLFEIFVLSSILQTVQSILLSFLQHSIKNLGHTS